MQASAMEGSVSEVARSRNLWYHEGVSLAGQAAEPSCWSAVTMSYNVAVVLPPVPAEADSAWVALDGFIKEQGPRPAVFQELHDRLTARYPCMCSVPDDRIDEIVWSDGPLINDFLHRAAVLGMSYSRVDEVLPFLLETANDLGLVVFDWATGTIYPAVTRRSSERRPPRPCAARSSLVLGGSRREHRDSCRFIRVESGSRADRQRTRPTSARLRSCRWPRARAPIRRAGLPIQSMPSEPGLPPGRPPRCSSWPRHG